MLLVLCLFSKNNNCTQKTEIPISKLHWCNLMDWVITFKIILTYFLLAYKSEKKMRLFIPLL